MQLDEANVAQQAHESQIQLKIDEIAELEAQQKTLRNRVTELEGANQRVNNEQADANAKTQQRIDELEQAQIALNEQISEMEASKQGIIFKNGYITMESQSAVMLICCLCRH